MAAAVTVVGRYFRQEGAGRSCAVVVLLGMRDWEALVVGAVSLLAGTVSGSAGRHWGPCAVVLLRGAQRLVGTPCADNYALSSQSP